ncbi:MAG: TetR/AcrR family transcriptional regulator [Acidimicrobiales bacterium]|nr:TetR/AcrR family transcriptional regulator [Acidimicrobiales bacterium]
MPRDGGPTRSAIIAAASSLLEAGGPDAVTLRSVGTAAGLSRSAPYRHFADKADLLAALALQTLIDLAAGVREAAAAGRKDSRLHRGCRAYVTLATTRPHHYQLIFGDRPISNPSSAIEAAADDGIAAFVDLVERAQANGELGEGPPRELATVLWALLHGLAQLQITGHLSEPRTVEGEAGLNALMALALASLRS